LTYKLDSSHFVSFFLISACVILALEPMLWLIRSWFSPDYDSPGAAVFACVVSLFVWSFSSPLQASARTTSLADTKVVPLCLLLATFVVRLASQLLAINLLGALMLALDVFALSLLARLGERRRGVNPMMLAALFCFALPLEVLLQRTLGFALQQLSATGACFLLSGIYTNASCEGVRILLDEVDVLVDLPCSGARVMILLLTGYFLLGALKPMSLGRVIGGLVFTTSLAWAVNTLRIVALAIGIRHESSTGIDVMLDPWHSGIGLAVSALGIFILLLWLHCQPVRAQNAEDRDVKPLLKQRAKMFQENKLRSIGLSGVAVIAAFIIVFLKPQPIDVSAPLVVPELPLTLDSHAQVSMPLSRQEKQYFATFGGAAARAGYGSGSLLLVRTRSPLRHLHTPDICFTASGHDMNYVGADFSDADFSRGPVAVYRSLSPAGEDLRVRVQFVSSSGYATHSISEVVWHWLQQPAQTWTMVQTVTPWNADSKNFLASVGRSLKLTTSLQQPI